MKKKALEIKNINFSRYEQEILHSLSLSVDVGDFVVLVGPNGSGKSTLAKIINGVVRPNSGEVFVGDKNIVNWPIYKRAELVSTLTQDLQHSTFSELSVAMNMELALKRSADKKSREQIIKYINSFNKSLGDRLDVKAGHLSGGQRQALALAMCFAHRPEILILDEHTSALDPKAAHSLMALTNAHVKQENLTTIMITHSLEHALLYGSRLIAMNEGRVILDLSGEAKSNLTKNELISKAY